MVGGTGKVYTFNWLASVGGAGATSVSFNFSFTPVSYLRIVQVTYTPYVQLATGAGASVTSGILTMSTPAGGEFVAPLDALNQGTSATAFSGRSASWKFGITNDGYETDFVLLPNYLVTVTCLNLVTVAGGDTLMGPVQFLYQRSQDGNEFKNYR